jgi:monoamine oxidase
VQIGYLRDGTEHALEADFALLALPLNRLSAIELDLPDAVRAALQDVEVADAIKITFETPVRPPQAPAGDETLRLLWPSSGTPQFPPRPQRIVTVYGNATALTQRLPPTRPGQIVQASALLRQASGDPALQLDHPLVVQWSRIPHALGAAARLPPDAQDAWHRLRAGVPPLFFAGDALSPLNGWQEGALESAQRAALALMRHARQPR